MWGMRQLYSASNSKVTPMHMFFKTLCAVSHGMVSVTFNCCCYMCTIANLTTLQVLDLVYEAIPYSL
jgi:hypothetical protein